jgi:hypothetical protein
MSVGAVAMNLSAIIVAVKAQLLRRVKLQRATFSMHDGGRPKSLAAKTVLKLGFTPGVNEPSG